MEDKNLSNIISNEENNSTENKIFEVIHTNIQENGNSNNTLNNIGQGSNDNHFAGKKRKKILKNKEKELEEKLNELDKELFDYSYNNSIYTKTNNKHIQNITKKKPSYYDIVYSVEDIFDELIRKTDCIRELGEDDTLQNESTLKRIALNNIIKFSEISGKNSKQNVIKKKVKEYIKINKELNYGNKLPIGKFCKFICIQLMEIESQVINKISTSKANNNNETFSNLDNTLHSFYDKLVSFFESNYNKNKKNNINTNLECPEDNFKNTIIKSSLDDIKSGITIGLNELQYYNKKIDKKFFEIHNIVINTLNELKDKIHIVKCYMGNIYGINLSVPLKLALHVSYKDKFELKDFLTSKIAGDLQYNYVDNLIEKINILYKVVCDAAQTQFSMVHKINYGDTIIYYWSIVRTILCRIKESMNSYIISRHLSLDDPLDMITYSAIDVSPEDIKVLSEVIDKLYNFRNNFFPGYVNVIF